MEIAVVPAWNPLSHSGLRILLIKDYLQITLLGLCCTRCPVHTCVAPPVTCMFTCAPRALSSRASAHRSSSQRASGMVLLGQGDAGVSCYPHCDPRCDPHGPSPWQQSHCSLAAVTSLAEHRTPRTNPVSSGRFRQSPCQHQDESLGI